MNFPFWPETASTIANDVDLLYISLLVFTLVWGGGLVLLMGYFVAKYRAGSKADRRHWSTGNSKLEWGWITVTTIIALILFVWSAVLFIDRQSVPQNAYQINVLAKQWMWKFYHPNGYREIDELHVPVGRPVVLKMHSDDVIHSFYVPAFRVKNDVLPQRFTEVWFEATKPGAYALFCAEYCGTRHSKMRGAIVALEPHEFEAWQSGHTVDDDLVARGRSLFMKHGCSGCHQAGAPYRAPHLDGIYGRRVTLMSGEGVIADEAYLRDSILVPHKQVVAGFAPIMPPFAGQLTEEEIFALVEYLKSLEGD